MLAARAILVRAVFYDIFYRNFLFLPPTSISLIAISMEKIMQLNIVRLLFISFVMSLAAVLTSGKVLWENMQHQHSAWKLPASITGFAIFLAIFLLNIIAIFVFTIKRKSVI